MKEYEVLRPHLGDRDYKVGDRRTANPVDVQHLVGTVLKEYETKVIEPKPTTNRRTNK